MRPAYPAKRPLMVPADGWLASPPRVPQGSQTQTHNSWVHASATVSGHTSLEAPAAQRQAPETPCTGLRRPQGPREHTSGSGETSLVIYVCTVVGKRPLKVTLDYCLVTGQKKTAQKGCVAASGHGQGPSVPHPQTSALGCSLHPPSQLCV